jgi:glutamyl-tRNA synthetase
VTESVRVRFAPSPTGALHVGGARTAIYNWAFARRTGGSFILRIDDTDPRRSTAENTAQILRSLRWLGLDWDEGPEVGGPFGPYFQTERAQNYRSALEQMKANGSAYACFCSTKDLEARRTLAQETRQARGYDRTCRNLDPAAAARRIAAGEPHVWRLAVPEDQGDIVVQDVIRGETVFPASAMDDYILVRADGTPTYNFATVVDDADMHISHVIRGDDHLPNTPRQVLVYQALGRPVPVFAHLPMIWGPDGRKLSKRHGATSVEAFRDEGYLPEALLNYLALLGWSLDGETTIVSPETLQSRFSLERISRSPAVFDHGKLEWMNGVYIRSLGGPELAVRLLPFLERAGLASARDFEERREWFVALATLVAERIKRLGEVVPWVRFLFEREISIDPEAANSILGREDAREALERVHQALSSLAEWTQQTIETSLRSLSEELGMKPRTLFQVVRVAIAGSTVSLPLFESLALLKQEVVLARLQAALASAAGSAPQADTMG